MRFTVLGSGTTLPDPERGPAGFLLQCGGRTLLVDGGSGTVQRLARAGVDARALDGGVYSHRHPDHTGDLVPLLFTLKNGIDRPRLRDYPIWAGAGFAGFLDGLRGVYGTWIQSEAWAVALTELPLDGPGRAELPGGVRLDTLPAAHGAGALHLRFTGPGGQTLVFSGDTGRSSNLVELSRGVDVLLTECGVPDEEAFDQHLCPSDIADLAREARPGRIVLTHFYPSVVESVALATIGATGVPVERGYDGMVIELGGTDSRAE